MPKIEMNENLFNQLLGKDLPEEELRDLLVIAKAELDERVAEEQLLKVELNDTNRPDLWSTAGLARQLRTYKTEKPVGYDFFSSETKSLDAKNHVIHVDPALEEIRPYITGFLADWKVIDETLLIDIIQSQEKLCENFGQKRKAIAMGVYRSQLMKFPVSYRAADPDDTRFIPLETDVELSLREILTRHPKGVEFGWIVEDFSRFPYLEDKNGNTLSFPPIINSAYVGAVEVGESQVFVELTGPNMDILLLATSIAACDFADLGFRIKPVRIEYPYETPYGKTVVTPFCFQKPISLEGEYANKLLGETLVVEEMAELLSRMGHTVSTNGGTIHLQPPPYRNDFLHPADVVEELMISRGMDSFVPVLPEEFTIGRLSQMELFSREVRDIMVGLGFQEMIYNYLGSRQDFIDKMKVPDEDFIEIENPMTENYAVVRKSIIPNLLSSESVSGNAVYPHKIFEIGKVAYRVDGENYGSVTSTFLGFLCADGEAGFNDVSSHIAAIFFYLARDFTLRDVEDPRFIPGRVGEILLQGSSVGIMGELHPEVLEAWGIQMPCASAELNLDGMIGP